MALKRMAGEIGRRQTPILGYRQIESGFFSGYRFAQAIISKYQAADEYRFPDADFVYLLQSVCREEEEGIKDLVRHISVMNQFRISITQHAYEEQHFLSLRMRCEQLFSFLSQSVIWQKSVNELRQIYQKIEQENLGKVNPLEEKNREKVWQKTKEKISRIEREIQEKIYFSHRDASFFRHWINEYPSRTQIRSFLWKSEQAKQFFWRVQRASKPEQTLILAAAKESSLTGLINRLNILDEKSWLIFSQRLREESETLLENQEFMDSVARQWAEEKVRENTLTRQDFIWKIYRWLEGHSWETDDKDEEVWQQKKEFLTLLEGESRADSQVWNQIKERIFHKTTGQNEDWYLSAAEAISYLNLEEWTVLKAEITEALNGRNFDEIPIVLWKNESKEREHFRAESEEKTQFYQEELIQMSEEKRELIDVLMQHKVLFSRDEYTKGRTSFFEQVIKDSSVLSEYIQWETKEVSETKFSLSEEINSLSNQEWKDWKKRVFLQLQQIEPTFFSDGKDEILSAEIQRKAGLEKRKEWLRSVMEAVSYLDSEEWQRLKTEFFEGVETLEEYSKEDDSPILHWITERKTNLDSSEGMAEKLDFLNAVSKQMEEETRLSRKDYQISEQLLKTSQVLSEYIKSAYTASDYQEVAESVFLTHSERVFDKQMSENWLFFLLEGMHRASIRENQEVLLHLAKEVISHLTADEWQTVKENLLENYSNLVQRTDRKTADGGILNEEKEEAVQMISRQIKDRMWLTKREEELLREMIKVSRILLSHDEWKGGLEQLTLRQIVQELSETVSQEKQLREKAGWIQAITDRVFFLEEKEWESLKTELWNAGNRSVYREGKESEKMEEIPLSVLNWLIKEREILIHERKSQENKGQTDLQRKDMEMEKKQFLQRLFWHISVQSAETKNMIYASLKSAIAEITRLDKISVKTSLWYSSIAEVISCLDVKEWGNFKTEVLEDDREELQWLERNKQASEQEEESIENITEKEKQRFLSVLLQQMTEESEYRRGREAGRSADKSQRTESESVKNRYYLLNQLQKKKDELLFYAREHAERIFTEVSEENKAQTVKNQITQPVDYLLPLAAEMIYLMKREKRNQLSEELSELFQESSTETGRTVIEQIQYMIKDVPESPQESLEGVKLDWMDGERKTGRKAEKTIQEEYNRILQVMDNYVPRLFFPEVSAHFSHYPIRISNVLRWLNQKDGKRMEAVQIIEQMRQERMVEQQIYLVRNRLTKGQELSGQGREREGETVYHLADITIAQNTSARNRQNQTEGLPVQREIQTEVKRQVEEQTDIQFITRGLDQSASAQPRREMEALIRQVESQQKEINQIKMQTEEKLSRQDSLKLSKTVMKTIKNQLDMERFRYGM